MSARNEIRRQLGNMPTGQYRLSGQEFSVRRVEPKPPELPVIEWQGIVIYLDPAIGDDCTMVVATRESPPRILYSGIFGEYEAWFPDEAQP